ncbi:MAG: sporulation peptidase YabG [Clostridia bacterium]|nr:sporulation peptidase YabG [Clostridia bacterium]
MPKFKIGDIVARKSYNYDVLFRITNISPNGIIDLVGITVRIIADAYDYDLKLIGKEELEIKLKNIEMSRRAKLNRSFNNINNKKNKMNYIREKESNYFIYQKEKTYKKPGRILHIDGDPEYTEKCKEMYKKFGISATVLNIEEKEQYKQIYNLLQRYKPEILILTGHDAFIKRRNDIYNIENYKNSKYYIQAVLEARKYEHNLDNLVIFAGACQSYYEAIISAGANFASAPKRVLIDMMDPLIVAETVAYTPVNEFVPLENIISNTREGIDGIGGLQTRGQYRIGMPGL